MSEVAAYLKPNGIEPVNTDELTLIVNDYKVAVRIDAGPDETGLRSGQVRLFENPIGRWRIDAGVDGMGVDMARALPRSRWWYSLRVSKPPSR